MAASKKLFALFIGINGYKECNPLSGCINDALETQRYFNMFCKTRGFTPQFKFLLAPLNKNDEKAIADAQIEYELPNRQNVVDALEALFAEADPQRGDCCLLYYSGHGSKMRVPEAFKLYEPSGRFQTLVCLDSRQENQRDLIDKELGYLIAKGLHGKTFDPENETRPGVQFVAIMDCCHAGNNLRSAKRKIVSRMTPGKNEAIKPEHILGFPGEGGNEFYKPLVNGQVARDGLKHTRYVSLSASRDHESAYETSFADGMDPRSEAPAENKQYGIFTYSLLRSLYLSGGQLSYAELAKRAELEIRTGGFPQRPLIWANPATNDDTFALFQKDAPQSSSDHFQITCKKQGETLVWSINAGKLHGITPSVTDQKTEFLLSDGPERRVEVTQVFTSHSRLDASAFKPEDQDKLLSATLVGLAIPRLKVGYDSSLPESARMEVKAAFQDVFEKRLAYFDLQDDDQGATVFIKQHVEVDINGKQNIRWMGVTPLGNAPLCIATADVFKLLNDLNKVGKWQYALQMSNPEDEKKYRKDIQVKIDVLEGKIIDNEDDQDAAPWQTKLNPPELSLRYINGIKPKIRVQVGLRDEAPRPYYIGAMYMSALYGIYPEMGKVKKIGFGNEDKQLRMSYAGNEVFSTELDDFLQERGITEITEYILVFVSSEAFDLDYFKQDPISLKGTEMGPGTAEETTSKFWFTIKIPIQVQRPLPALTLSSDSLVPLTRIIEADEEQERTQVLRFKTPEGFNAQVQALTPAQLLKSAATQVEKKAADIPEVPLLPPADLWQGAKTDVNPFCLGMAGPENSHLSVLDFLDSEGSLSTEHPLTLQLQERLQNPFQEGLALDWDTPTLDHEVVVPFGLYEDSDGTLFHIPLGFTDSNGEILLTQLPNWEDSALDPAAQGDKKSIGTALRAWFQKLVWSRLSGRHEYNTLALHRKDTEPILYRSKAQRYLAAKEDIKTVLSSANRVLLLIHGIIGESKEMLPAFLEHPELAADFDAILTFDYENLNTPIETTAGTLHEMLDACGLKADKKLTIVAHSMGGLVSRWWIEKGGGSAYVNKLIQAGTPNAGTDIELFRQKLISLMTLGINAVARFKPYLANLSFLTGGLGKSLFKTLAQMGPESAFFQSLNTSSAPAVPYYLLAGDTSNIEAVFKDDDPLWHKIWACLRDRIHYLLVDTLVFKQEPNDLAVSTTSMKTLPWGTHSLVLEPQCDHLGYFENEESITMLKQLIKL